MRGAAGHEQADPDRDELRPRSGTAHRATEHTVRRDDAGNVRAVLTRHDADVDRLGLAVDLDDEGHPLGDRCGRVVRAEVADIAVDLVVRHRRLVGEAQVLVDVDPDLRAAVPQDAERAVGARRIAVTVDVVADLSAEVRMALVEHAETKRPGARRGVGRGPDREGRSADGVGEDPGRVAVIGRVRVGDPVDELRGAGRRGRERRVVEADPEVQDADGHSSAVPGGMVPGERCSARLRDRHVGVRPGRRGVRGRERRRAGLTLRPWIGQRDELVDFERLNAPKRGRSSDLVAGDHRADVIDRVVAVADGRAQALQPRHDRVVRSRPGRDQHGHRVLAIGLGLGDEGPVLLGNAPAFRSGGGDGLGQDGSA